MQTVFTVDGLISYYHGISVIWPALSIALTGIVLGFYNETEAEALQSAEYANRAKTEFLFNMSHDIRTPMNVISNAIKYNREGGRVAKPIDVKELFGFLENLLI